ncbi:hypothetical protein R6Q57_028472 [Mikania cordata]
MRGAHHVFFGALPPTQKREGLIRYQTHGVKRDKGKKRRGDGNTCGDDVDRGCSKKFMPQRDEQLTSNSSSVGSQANTDRLKPNLARRYLIAELVRFSITENGETALHVAASAKGDPKEVEQFVRKLVDLMKKEDLELENENFNTALYLAAAAGNVETVKIMVEKTGS